MQMFSDTRGSAGMLWQLGAYLGAAGALVVIILFAFAEFTAPAQKIAAVPRAATDGIAEKEEPEISARERSPVWIAATTRYAYTPPPPRARKAVQPQPPAASRSRRMNDSALQALGRYGGSNDSSSQTLGYAATPQRNAASVRDAAPAPAPQRSSFQSPIYRDGML